MNLLRQFCGIISLFFFINVWGFLLAFSLKNCLDVLSDFCIFSKKLKQEAYGTHRLPEQQCLKSDRSLAQIA